MDGVEGLLGSLHNLESMTWGELLNNHKKNHPVSVESLCGEAKKRLQELEMDDLDDMLSVGQLGSRKRIWGIRDGPILRVLWWDPDHRICPSALRHT